LVAQMESAYGAEQKKQPPPQKAKGQQAKTQQGRAPQGKVQQPKAQQGKASKQEAKEEVSPYERVSLAIENCPTDAIFASERKRLRVVQVKLQSEETLKLNPKLCVQFEDLTWTQYYSGTSNIKYPDVRGLEAWVANLKPVEKMMLFDLLQGQRHQCCKFNPGVLTRFSSKKECEDYPAIIIPSGGKDGKWLGHALNNAADFWWVRCLDFAQVIFAVSNLELDNYQQFADKGITVVGYEGFGMGCGRAAGINIAKQLGRVCIMTDDRTKGLTWETDKQNTDLTKEELKTLIDESAETDFIMGVCPKGELNILTIINPLSPRPQQPVFSPYFIASKEDKALYQFCRVLQLRHNCTVGEMDWTRRVCFDASNPVYLNTPSSFSGEKGRAISCVTSSRLYCSTEGTPLDWKHLSSRKEFKNEWDAVKMQDSAMFLLLKNIVEGILEMKTVPDDFWEQFDKYIAPWFT
ncbi:MAG TPA: hypothetical protein VFA15_03765, partial [Nitrososphaera sp.]|nr:hypothetical protein [Nitrososphaera sp.]